MFIKNFVCGVTLAVPGVWEMHVVVCEVALSLFHFSSNCSLVPHETVSQGKQDYRYMQIPHTIYVNQLVFIL